MLTARKVDGLIFMGELNPNYLRTAVQSALPFVLLDFYDDEAGADSIISDSLSGGYQLASHLLKSGRKSIAFVGSIFSTSSIMDRYLGYTKALLRGGIQPRADWLLEDRDRDGNLISFDLPDEMPQAFMCSCDEVAYHLVEKLKRAGYRIPQDIAVTGYDDYRFSQICDPQLTTYRVDAEGMGMAAATHLIRLLQGKRVSHGIQTLNGKLICRQST